MQGFSPISSRAGTPAAVEPAAVEPAAVELAADPGAAWSPARDPAITTRSVSSAGRTGSRSTGQCRAGPAVRPRPRTWQLASYLTGAGWQAGKVGASTGELSCPSVAVCYLSAAQPVPISGFNVPSPTYDIRP